MSDTLYITIPVRAIPGGNSKMAFVSPKTGRAFVVDKTRGKDQFIATVRQFAAAAANDAGFEVIGGAAVLFVNFHFARPKGHYGTGKNAGTVKPRFAQARPAVKPDLTNIVKRVEDALTGIAWKDDCQVVETHASKMWGETDSVEVCVEAISVRSILGSAIAPNFAQDASEAT